MGCCKVRELKNPQWTPTDYSIGSAFYLGEVDILNISNNHDFLPIIYYIHPLYISKIE
jgi:hypothetical protein